MDGSATHEHHHHQQQHQNYQQPDLGSGVRAQHPSPVCVGCLVGAVTCLYYHTRIYVHYTLLHSLSGLDNDEGRIEVHFIFKSRRVNNKGGFVPKATLYYQSVSQSVEVLSLRDSNK